MSLIQRVFRKLKISKKISPNTFQICAIRPLKTTKPQTFPALDWSRALRISRSVSGACATSCVAGVVKEEGGRKTRGKSLDLEVIVH